MPARVFFVGRGWPEGFVFPACGACNAATRADEQLLAFFALMGGDFSHPQAFEEWQKLRSAVRNNHPDVYRRLLMSPTETRKALRETGLPRLPGVPLAEHPLIKVPGRALNRAARRVGYKIGAALYYRHITRPLSPEGACYVYFRTNVQVMQGDLDPGLLDILPFKENLKRASRVLDDQVRIWTGQDESGEAAAALTMFRGGFAVVSLIAADHRALSSGDDDEEHISCFRPLTWRTKLVTSSSHG